MMTVRPLMRRLLPNLEIAIGVSLAASVAILSALNVADQQIVSAVVLALLALVLSVFFRIRATLVRINNEATANAKTLEQVSIELAERTNASKIFRHDYPDLAEEIAEAAHIFVVAGGSLVTSVGFYFYQFRSAVSDGAVVRLICPDPTDADLMRRLAATEATDFESTTNDVQANLSLAARLSKIAPNASDFAIRTVDTLPTQGIIYTRKRCHLNSAEHIWAKLLTYGHYSGIAPVFEISPIQDSELFKLFRTSMEEIWKAGREVDDSRLLNVRRAPYGVTGATGQGGARSHPSPSRRQAGGGCHVAPGSFRGWPRRVSRPFGLAESSSRSSN